MKRASFALLLPLLALLVPGCYGFLPAPPRRDRVREATEQEGKRCRAQPPVDARIYGPDDVESVAPLYAHVQSSGSNVEAHLLGAELRLRPLPAFTPELVNHALACRSVALVLGHAQEAPNEPYWLPDGWVKIDVRSDDGSFVVALEGEDFAEAKEILSRAKAFAGGKP